MEAREVGLFKVVPPEGDSVPPPRAMYLRVLVVDGDLRLYIWYPGTRNWVPLDNLTIEVKSQRTRGGGM